MERLEESSAQPAARTIGIVYLLYFLLAFLTTFLMRGVVVPGDAAATASNLAAHEVSYRCGLALGLAGNAVYIAVTALFYRLFGPVNWSISLIAAFISLAGCIVQIAGGLLQLAPLLILHDAQLAAAFNPQQLQAAALASIALYARVFHISLVLFAFYDLLLGYLIFRSAFVPRTLGAFLMLAGVGWLTFLWPPLATALSSLVLPFGALAELALMVWLIVRGGRALKIRLASRPR